VLQKGDIPYFEDFVNDFLENMGGFHEIGLTNPNLNLDGTYFDDVITYMETGTLPLETEDLHRLLGLRKIFDYFAPKLPNARRGYVLGGRQVERSPFYASGPRSTLELLRCSSFSSDLQSTVYAYDPQEDTWDIMASMPFPLRDRFATACVGTDIYVMGGNTTKFQPSLGAVMSKYDSLTDTWTEEEDMIISRKDSCSAVVGKKIYVMGGNYSRRVEVYDTEEKTWTLLPETMPEMLSGGTACAKKQWNSHLFVRDQEDP
jgi:hypothetical protein